MRVRVPVLHNLKLPLDLTPAPHQIILSMFIRDCHSFKNAKDERARVSVQA